MNTQLPGLIHALLSPSIYPHPTGEIRLIETHISWVILTGQFVYKLKKPVDFGFLDFSSLELRRHFCEEELRLNRRLAPQLYLDVVPITGSPEQPALGGSGNAIEYAVRMRQFNPAHQLDHLIAAGQPPNRSVMDGLAAHLVAFHHEAAQAGPADDYGTPESILRPVIENFEQITALPYTADEADSLRELRQWSERTHAALIPTLHQRKQGGHVRECHGDLHLANLAIIGDEAVPFDCLEFSPGLRWIDCVSEIAFLLMDLDYHDQYDPGLQFLNAWLHHGGDHDGLACLRFYLVYRAMVRAKVACIRAQQAGSDHERDNLLGQYSRHLELARDYTRPRAQALIITHGVSGCGKTTLTDDLLAPLRALRVRSDVERKRLHGLTPGARSGSTLGEGIYNAAAGQQTYDRLADLAAMIIDAGYSAIVDATFLRRDQRQRFRELASRLGVPFIILDIRADEADLRERVSQRAAMAQDASEAGIAVLQQQLRERDPLQTDEQLVTLAVETEMPRDSDGLARRISERVDELRVRDA